MPAGRPRTPSHLKLVRGTARSDRTNPREPKPEKGIPPTPAHMTPHGKKAWRYLAPLINRTGVLTKSDAVALEQASELYGSILAARERLREPIMGSRYDRKTGLTVVFEVAAANARTYTTFGSTGVTVRDRPEHDVIKEARRELLRYLTEFGLTPASRSKVSALPDERKADPAAKYFT